MYALKQFTLPLDKETQRPITFLQNWYGLDAMIDTGSLFPVWVGDEEILSKLGAEVLIDNVKFGGFGGNAHGRLYVIPTFQFGELIYPNFHIIAHKMESPCQMILPATMFRKLRYEIDDENHMFNVTIPEHQSNVRNLVIKDFDGKLHVLCTPGEIVSL